MAVDGAIIGRLAAVTLIVLQAGPHALREVALVAKRFRQANMTLHGAIKNDARLCARSAS